MRLKIRLGALAPKLYQQLNDAGIDGYNIEHIDRFQKDADAISRLSVKGFISESVAGKARARLMKNICTYLESRP